MTCTRRKSPLIYSYKLGIVTIDRVSEFKDLGVIFDDQLSFRRHIDVVVGVSMRMLGFVIRNTEAFSDVEAIKTLYFALVRSRLEYASIIWNPLYEVHKAVIERVQRKFLKYLHFKLRGVYPARGYDNILLLREFNVQSLESRRLLQSLTFLHRLSNCQINCPDLFSLLELCEPRECSRTRHMFVCPRATTNMLVKSPVYLMINTYNKISRYCNIFDCTLQSLVRTAVDRLHLV